MKRCKVSGVVFAAFVLLIAMTAIGAAQENDSDLDTPRVEIQQPQTGIAVSGDDVNLRVWYKRTKRPLKSLLFFLDEQQIFSDDMSQSGESGTIDYRFNTVMFPDGIHRLSIRLVDATGISATHTTVVFIANRTLSLYKPTATIMGLMNGQMVRGLVNVGVHATSETGVAWVLLFVDTRMINLRNVLPNEFRGQTVELGFKWDTTNYRNGPHRIYAKAIDFFRKEGVSDPIQVIVNNIGGFTDINPREGPVNPVDKDRSMVVLPRTPKPLTPMPTIHPTIDGDIAGADSNLHLIVVSPIGPDSSMPDTGLRKVPPRFTISSGSATAASPLTVDAVVQFPGGKLIVIAPESSDPGIPIRTLPNGEKIALIQPGIANSSNTVSFKTPSASSLSPTASLPQPGKSSRQMTLGAPALTTANSGLSGTSSRMAPMQPSLFKMSRQVAANPDAPGHSARLASADATLTAAVGPQTSVLLAQLSARKPIHTEITNDASVALPDAKVRTLGSDAPRSGGIRIATRPDSAKPRVSPPVTEIRKPVASGLTRVSSHMVHVVRKGESLAEIARTYGVLPSAIVAANVLRNPRHVVVGQKLQIPKEYTTELNGRKINSDVQSFATPQGPVAPFRPIMEGTGADVKWKPETRTVNAQTRNKQIQLRIGEREALINGEKLMMDLASFLTRGRTMVPVTFFRQALDATVVVDPDSGRIIITSP